jgi:DNA (cytosine-5)-methyltransferase 1
MAAYYNEIDAFAAQWLRNLIAAGHIAPGDVDERSITDVRADDLKGYAQCHFFAGIGGWSYALYLAGWPDDRPVWTGSCPCQPFSAAGKAKGKQDERHLWPAFFRLIRECRPGVVFGEQVAAAIGFDWLDHVCDDLEHEGYAVGPVVLPACSVGAPHIRSRLWFVAESNATERRSDVAGWNDSDRHSPGRIESDDQLGERRALGSMAESNGRNASTEGIQRSGQQRQQPQDRSACSMADLQGQRCGQGSADPSRGDERIGPQGTGQRLTDDGCGGVDDADGEGPQGRIKRGDGSNEQPAWSPSLARFWADAEWIDCSDGKARPTQPGLFPLAHGVPGRLGRLRAYGNAIVPQVAAKFIEASMI